MAMWPIAIEAIANEALALERMCLRATFVLTLGRVAAPESFAAVR